MRALGPAEEGFGWTNDQRWSPPQFRGTSYQAANWTYLGETRGRGRMDHHHEAHGRSVKRIYILSSLSQCAAPTRAKLRAALVPKGEA